MKSLSIYSVLTGILGITLIFWFDLQLNARYQELGGISELVSLFRYGTTTYLTLLISQFSGLICGLIPSMKTKLKTGYIGVLLCLLTTTILLIQSR